MTSCNEHILDGFDLNSDMLWEMRRLLEKRPQSKFSDGLSEEAKQVIYELKEESKPVASVAMNAEPIEYDQYRRLSKTKIQQSKRQQKDSRRKSHVSYADFTHRSPRRQENDVTDIKFNDDKQSKWNYDVGQGESVMNNIEICDSTNVDDDFAIEETAKHNSVEKCIDWMEDNNNCDSKTGALHE